MATGPVMSTLLVLVSLSSVLLHYATLFVCLLLQTESEVLYELYNQCLSHFMQQCPLATMTASELVIESKPHLSLSRPFTLRYHQIKPFVNKMTTLVALETLR